MRPSLDLPSTLNSSCEQSLTSAPPIVLDTNAVLDWLLFDDPAMSGLAAKITSGQVRWIATAAMRSELEHVLGRGLAARRGSDTVNIPGRWARHCLECPPAPPAPAHLRCTDTDDQKFLDLALASGARWLVSRDRALLKLGRRAARQGMTIVMPARWRFNEG